MSRACFWPLWIEIQEKLVNARVIGKFGMKCSGHSASLPHYNGVIAFGCDYFNPFANVAKFSGLG